MPEGESTFGPLLRQTREAAGLSRSDLAERVGLDVSHLYRMETGGRRPSRESALALAAALHVGDAETNRWLSAAGYSPLPLLSLVRGAVRSRGARHVPGTEASPSPEWQPANWAAWLDAIGLHETSVRDLLRAMEGAPLATRQGVAESMRAAFSCVTEILSAPVRKAIIPTAGGQHRLLATHVMQHLILRAVHEAAEAGIAEVLLVLAPGSIDGLYVPLKAALDLAIVPGIRLQYAEQPSPAGLGDAILQAERFVASAPFAVLLPDDVVRARIGRSSHPRELARMMNALAQLGLQGRGHLVATTNVSRSRMSFGGVVEVGSPEALPGTRPVKHLIEKPAPSDPICRKHNVARIVGRYLLQPSIFEALRELQGSGASLLQLTDALELLRQRGERIYAFALEAARQDVGTALGQASDLIEDSLRSG